MSFENAFLMVLIAAPLGLIGLLAAAFWQARNGSRLKAAAFFVAAMLPAAAAGLLPWPFAPSLLVAALAAATLLTLAEAVVLARQGRWLAALLHGLLAVIILTFVIL